MCCIGFIVLIDKALDYCKYESIEIMNELNCSQELDTN